jgi:hypothetical protein
MICIIAGNEKEAYQWARGQGLSKDEWFYPYDEAALKTRTDFHVIVVGTAGENVPSGFFEKIYSLAKSQGRKK